MHASACPRRSRRPGAQDTGGGLGARRLGDSVTTTGEAPTNAGGPSAEASGAYSSLSSEAAVGTAMRHDLLEPRDRLRLERLLLWLRLGFLAVAILPPLNFGMRGVPYAALIAVCVICSYAWVWVLLRRFPAVLLRW